VTWRGWKEKMRNREQWRLVVKRPRLTQGCSAEEEEERHCYNYNY
jgi:hypothetical protein